MTTLKTVAARIRSSEADYDKDAPDYEGLAESASKYRKEIMALSGVDIMKNENEYKSTKQIFEEIASVWNQMSDVSQAALAERLGGKRNMNVVMSIIQNIKDLKGAYEDSMSAAGTAAEANDIYMDSISGKVGQFKAQWDVFSSTALDSDMVKPFVGGATQLLSILTKLIEVLGKLGPLISVPAAVAAGKGFYKLAQDLSEIDGVVGVLSKKFVGLGDSIGSGLSNIKNSNFAGAIKNLMAVAPGTVVAAGGAIVAGMALLGVAAYEAYESSFTGRFNSFKEKLEKTQQLESDVASYDSQIESNKNRIEALKAVQNSTNNLTAAEAAELKALQSQTAELIRQKDIKDSLAQSAKADTANSAYELLNTQRWTTSAPVSGAQDHYSITSQTLEESLASETESYRAYLKARDEASEKVAELAKAGKEGSSEYISWQQRYEKMSDKLQEVGGYLTRDLEEATSIANALDRTTAAGEHAGQSIDAAIINGTRAMDEGIGKTPYDRLEEFSSSGLFKEADTDLKALSATGRVGAKDIEAYRKKYSEFDQALRDGGITTKEAANYYSDLNKQTGALGSATDSAGLILGHYADDLQTIETNLGTLDQAQEKLSSGEFSITDLALLEKQFPGVLDGVDATSGSFDGLSDSIRRLKEEQPDALIERLEEMKSRATSDAQIASINSVIDAVRELGNASEVTSSQYGGMGRVIAEANDAAKGTAEVLNQGESNAAYTIDVSAYEQLKKYADVGAQGTGNIKNWQLADRLFGGFDNITFDNIDKKRERLNKLLSRWGSIWKNTDKEGNLTSQGAQNFLNKFSSDSGVAERLKALGDTISYNNKTGAWTIDVDEGHLEILAKEAGLTTDALKDLFIQVSQFLDIDWNDNGATSFFDRLRLGLVGGKMSELSPDAYTITDKKIKLDFERAREAASQMGISVEDYVTGLEKESGRTVVLLDKEGKKVKKKTRKSADQIGKNADRHQGRAHEDEQTRGAEHNTDRHQGRKKEPPKDAWAYDNKPKVVPEVDTTKADKEVKKAKDNWENIENPPKVPLKTDDNFIDEAKEKLDKTLPKVPVEADTSKAEKEVKQTKDNWENIENPPKIPLETDGSFIDQAKDKLDKTLPTVEVGADTSKADEKVKQTKDNWENIPSDVKVDADTSTADEEVKHAKDNWENIPSDVKVDADASGADKEVDKVKAGIESSPAKITVEADTKPAEKKIDKVKRPDYSGSSDRHQGRQHESEQVKRDSHYAKGAATAVGGKVGSIVKSTVDKIKNGSTQNTMTVDANTSPAQQKINALIQQIEGKTYKINVDTSGGESGGASITESATKSVTGFAGKIAGLFRNRKVNISANVSGTKEVDNLNKSTKQVKGKKVEVKATPKGEPGVKSLHKGIEQVKPKKVDVKANPKGEREVKSLKSSIDRVKGKGVDVKVSTTGTGLVSGLLSKLGQLRDKKVTVTTEHVTVNKKIYTEGAKRRRSNQGSSGLFGNAFKSGTWGAKNSGRALGGEIGRKLLRPRIAICG